MAKTDKKQDKGKKKPKPNLDETFKLHTDFDSAIKTLITPAPEKKKDNKSWLLRLSR